MSSAERNLILHPLRFTRDLERAFQDDYYARFRPLLRYASLLFIAILLLIGSREQGERIPLDVRLTFTGTQVVSLLLLWSLTFWRGFGRIWQQYIVFTTFPVYCVVLHAVALYAVQAPGLTTPEGRAYRLLTTLLILMAALSTARLQFVWATLLQLQLAGIGAWATVSILSLPPGDVAELYSRTVAPAVVAFMVLAYAQERLQRDAFLANHLLGLERERTESLMLNMLPAPSPSASRHPPTSSRTTTRR